MLCMILFLLHKYEVSVTYLFHVNKYILIILQELPVVSCRVVIQYHIAHVLHSCVQLYFPMKFLTNIYGDICIVK